VVLCTQQFADVPLPRYYVIWLISERASNQTGTRVLTIPITLPRARWRSYLVSEAARCRTESCLYRFCFGCKTLVRGLSGYVRKRRTYREQNDIEHEMSL